MITLAFVVPLVSGQVDLLAAVSKHYQSLKRFEATIEHHDDSGLFPGEYTQKLVWTGKGKFTLKVIKPSSSKVKAPDYVADGQMVTSTSQGKVVKRESVEPRPMSSPGWEVSGGIALMMLQQTSTGKMVVNPPKEFKLTWKMGPTKSWQGQAVRELVGSFDKKEAIHLFLHPSQPRVIGMQALSGAKGWMIYRNVKES